MSQITKIFLIVLLKRTLAKIKPQVEEEQFGFVAEKGNDQCFIYVQSFEGKSLEVKKDVFICFVNYEKAFTSLKYGIRNYLRY